jgi:hypothetical protein
MGVTISAPFRLRIIHTVLSELIKRGKQKQRKEGHGVLRGCDVLHAVANDEINTRQSGLALNLSPMLKCALQCLRLHVALFH